MEAQWTPPYMHQGLYAIETRKLIEAANRATIAAIFERRRQREKQRKWEEKIRRMHDSGIHMPGYCPHCPANVYYD